MNELSLEIKENKEDLIDAYNALFNTQMILSSVNMNLDSYHKTTWELEMALSEVWNNLKATKDKLYEVRF